MGVNYPYIPNSNESVKREMLDTLGIQAVEEIYSFIPQELRLDRPLNLPKPYLSEWELKQHLPETFPEFLPYLDDCRFTGCQHVKEKGCAVLQAVKDGRIPESRHRSYVRLYEELKPLKEWEQGKKMPSA